jgi:hypothetical protein
MIVPKDARALLHYRRCARPRHLRVLRGERGGDIHASAFAQLGLSTAYPRGPTFGMSVNGQL